MHKLLQNLLVIDIETISGQRDFEKLSADMQHHWERKAQFLRNAEELSSAELYNQRAAIYAEFGQVVVIGMGFFHEVGGEPALRVKSLASDNEKEMLETFASIINTKFDPELLKLCAHNGKEFDFPYLCRRLLINGISIPYTLDIGGKKPWEVRHLDTMEMWKFGDWKAFTSLDLLTSIFNIPTSKDDMDGSMVTKTFYEQEGGLDRIATYCRKDVVATSQLFLRLNNLPLIPEDLITIIA